MIISDIQIGERLDRFLANTLPTTSRTVIQHRIQDGSITVNGKVVVKHYALKAGDTIELSETATQPPIQFTLEANSAVQVNVIDEQPDYVVIHKAAGVIVHPGDGHMMNDTLVSGILAKYPEIADVGDSPLRPGIVHRLDKDVSGVMVVARNMKMFAHLKQQFQNRSVVKKYVALVHGVLSQPVGEITLSISRSQRDRKKMAAHRDESGKPAHTLYSVIQQFQHYALVSVQILTGRTHQIRVHFNAIGHPVVGDTVYKPKKLKSRLLLDRIFLHAQELHFSTLEGKTVEYTVPIPSTLQQIVDDLYSTI